MADSTAIRGVSATLRALLRDRIERPPEAAADVPVTVGTPRADELPDEGAVESPRVNLFLYRVSQSPALRNQEIPGRGRGDGYGHPPLSLDLHYMITAYGSTEDTPYFDESPAQALLGSAMRVLHDHATLTEDLATVRDPAGQPILHPSLSGEFERVKISPDPLSLEDLTKIWTALTLPYRLSAAYTVSVVQIESRLPNRYPKRVGEPPSAGPRVYAVPLQRPRVEEVLVRRAGDPAAAERPVPLARVGDTLVLRGSRLSGDEARVRIGELTLPVRKEGVDRVTAVIPDDALPNGAPIAEADRLRPGVHAVHVEAGVAALPGAGVPSNALAFLLAPRVDALERNAGGGPIRITVRGARVFDPRLGGETLLGTAVIPKSAYRDPSPSTFTFDLPDTFPRWPFPVLVSGDLSAFPALPGGTSLDVRMQIGTTPARTITLETVPVSLSHAADLLQRAARRAFDSDASARLTRVVATADRLVVVPGDLNAAVIVDPGEVADALKLTTATGAGPRDAAVSGTLDPFPALTAGAPRLRLTLGTTTRDVALAGRPTSLADAAGKLEAAIRSLGADPAFADARVVPIGSQLLLVPGTAGGIAVAGVAGQDDRTISELQWRATYPVRVRVNGAEDVDGKEVELPS